VVDSDGAWHRAENWSSAPLLPSAGDDITLDRPAASFTVSHERGASTVRGLVNAEVLRVAGGSSLTVSLATAGGTNTGTLRGESGTLTLGAGLLANAGGALEAWDGGAVVLAGTTVVGGTLATLGAGVIGTQNGSAATLEGVTIEGRYDAGGSLNTRTDLAGAITNRGTLAMNATGTASVLRLVGDVSLVGPGTVQMSAHPANFISGASGANRLTQGADHSIRGSGQLGANTLALTNLGLVVADQATVLIIDPRDGDDGVVNAGTLRAEDGGTLQLVAGSFSNGAGTIEALEGSRVELAGATVIGGTLATRGDGVVGTQNGSVATLDGVTLLGTYDAGGSLNTRTDLANTITNRGTLAMNATLTSSEVRLLGDVTLTGSGELVMSDRTSNRIVGNSGVNQLTHGADHTIRGSGQLGANTLALTNLGLVAADQATALIIDPRDGEDGVVNAGTLRAEGGGTLRLAGGSFNNAAGTIEALAGSRVELAAATVTGGTLATQGDGVVGTQNGSIATLDGVTLLGTYDAGGSLNTRTDLANTITNRGTLAMNATLTASEVRLLGEVTLAGPGELVMSDRSNNWIVGNTADSRLTNAADHTLRGAGQLGVNSIAIHNQGLFRASGTTALVVDPGAGGLDNPGSLQVDAGSTLTVVDGLNDYDRVTRTLRRGTYAIAGTLRLADADIAANAAHIILDGPDARLRRHDTGGDALANLARNEAGGRLEVRNGRRLDVAGAFDNAGELAVGAGSLIASRETLENSGLVGGAGTVQARTLTSRGTLRPGDATPGALAVDGDLVLEAAGRVVIELAGASLFDRLAVTGTADLDGVLEVRGLAGFGASLGDDLVVMTFDGGRGGTAFAAIEFLALGPFVFEAVYGDTSLALRVSAIPLPPALVLLVAPLAVLLSLPRNGLRAGGRRAVVGGSIRAT
jgi:hypothetical protein